MSRKHTHPDPKSPTEDTIAIDDNELAEDEGFDRTLIGKIWTESPYNIRAFKQTMIQAWRLKHPVDIQDLNKNLFLFRFTSKREVDAVLSAGPWSFDRNLVILSRVTGTEQPSEMDLSRVYFWTRVYDLPLKLRTEAVARKIGNLIGDFEEIDMNDAHRNGRFLRLKASIDLNEPLKRGTKLVFQKKDIWADFKYERLPNFCFICGKIGHQIKDCEVDEAEADAYSDLEVKHQSYGPWLRASPLPRITEEQKRDTSSGTCNRSLFSSTSASKAKVVEKERGEDEEVSQSKQNRGKASELLPQSPLLTPVYPSLVEIEEVAESLGTVALTKTFDPGNVSSVKKDGQPRKWTRKKPSVPRKIKAKVDAQETGKRKLFDVMVTDVLWWKLGLRIRS